MHGPYRLPYGGGTRVPYCETEILYGGGSAFNGCEFHHPVQEQKIAQMRRIQAHSEKLSAQAAMKLAELQCPYDTASSNQNWGDMAGTHRHNQAYPCDGGLESVQKKDLAQESKCSPACRGPADAMWGRQRLCGYHRHPKAHRWDPPRHDGEDGWAPRDGDEI